MTPIVATTDIATSDPFILSGPARIRADDIPEGATVTIYEERVDGGYEPARDGGVQIQLTRTQPSRIVEGYGNYKALKSVSTIGDVGYEN